MSLEDIASQVGLRQGGERLPCLLLIDTSGSMGTHGRIEQVNAGLQELKSSLMDGNLTRANVEIAIVTFDSEVVVRNDFELADNFDPPALTAQGLTFLGRALIEAVNMIKERRRHYRDLGIPFKRPLLFIISDGMPEGEPPQLADEAGNAMREAVSEKKMVVWPLVVGNGIEASELSRISGGNATRLDEAKWSEMWKWLSESLSAMSSSKPGTQAALPPRDWTYSG